MRAGLRASVVLLLALSACSPRARPRAGPDQGAARQVFALTGKAPDRSAVYRIAARVQGANRWDLWTRLRVSTSAQPLQPKPGVDPIEQVRTGFRIEGLDVLHATEDPDRPAPSVLVGLRLVDLRGTSFARVRPPEVKPRDLATTKPDRDMTGLMKGFMAARQLATALDLAHQLQYPEQPVRAGQGWSPPGHTLNVPGLGTVRVRGAYVYRGERLEGGQRLGVIDAELDLRATPRRPFRSLQLTGTGSGSARFEVNLADGSLHSTETNLSFMQELTGRADTIIAQREAFLHVRGGPAIAHAAPEDIPVPGFPDGAGVDPTCKQDTARLAAFVSGLPPIQTHNLGAAARDVRLPVGEGEALVQEGVVLALERDGATGSLLDRGVRPRDLAKTLAPLFGMRLYVYADRTLPLAKLAPWLQLVPPRFAPALLVRTAAAGPSQPPTWQRHAMGLALGSSSLTHRRSNLQRLLFAQLQLCGAAQAAVRSADAADTRPGAELVAAVRRCGCQRVDVPALRATLSTCHGSPDLRAVPIAGLPPAGTVADLLP